MIAAVLAERRPETSSCEVLSRSGSAQVNDRGEVLFPLERRRGTTAYFHRACHMTIEQCCSHFDRMARQDTAVKAVKPAGIHVVPGASLDYFVLVDAVAFRLLEGSIGYLEHAYRA